MEKYLDKKKIFRLKVPLSIIYLFMTPLSSLNKGRRPYEILRKTEKGDYVCIS